MAQKYRRSLTKHRKATEEGTCMAKTGDDLSGLHLVNFEKPRRSFFSNLRYLQQNIYQNVIYKAGKLS